MRSTVGIPVVYGREDVKGAQCTAVQQLRCVS